MKWVSLFMSIRLKRNFRKTMAKYGSLDKTHTNRIRMVLSFATNARKDMDKRKAGSVIKWMMYNNKFDFIRKVINFGIRVRYI